MNSSAEIWLIKNSKIYYFLLILLFIASCQGETETFPDTLEDAIDLFYEENRNDSVLKLLEDKTLASISEKDKKIAQMVQIFRAAALCEMGKMSEARNTLFHVQVSGNDEQVKYYYDSILGLIDFREYKLEEAFNTLIHLIENEEQDVRALALNQRIIGRILIVHADEKNALYWLLQSKDNFEKAKLEKSVAVNDKFIGILCKEAGRYDEAYNYLTAAENVFRVFDDKDELFYINIILGDIKIKQRKFEESFPFVLKALEYSKFSNDIQIKVHELYNLGEMEKLKGNYASAVEYFNSIEKYGINFHNAKRIKQLVNLNFAEIYNNLHQYEKARSYVYKVLDDKEDVLNASLKHQAYFELAKSYAPSDIKTMNSLLDSSVMFLNTYRSSQSESLIKMFEAQHELHEARILTDTLKSKSRTQTTFYIINSLFLLIVILVILKISSIRKDKNKALLELVKKNLLLLAQEEKNSMLMQEQKQFKNVNARISNDEKTSNIYNEFIAWLEEGQKYKQKDLTIDFVAKQLKTNREYLSKAIGDKNLRFVEVINKYRIQDVIHILSNPSDIRNKYSLTEIAQEVGFNSQSVFIEAFKKNTGMTPAQFRDHANITVI